MEDFRTIRPLLFDDRRKKFLFRSRTKDFSLLRAYQRKGDAALRQLHGEFGLVYEDMKTGKIVAARDWVGEVPLHYLQQGKRVYFANFISDLAAKVPRFSYDRVVAVNRSEVVEINTRTGKVSKRLYYNFQNEESGVQYDDLEHVAAVVHDLLLRAVQSRMPSRGKQTGLLLSGGIDSMSIAYFVSTLNKRIPAYTIEVASEQSTDLIRAHAVAKTFGLNHRIINVSTKDILDNVRNAVAESEIYHMYNVFCAVGMSILARTLKADRMRYAYTGEGGNEAFGDYHDWVVRDARRNKNVVLQRTAKEFDQPRGREAYIWGNLKAEAHGRYNRQLGSGLGKHGGSRMYKPMFKHGITLLSPYLEKRIMKILANIPAKQLADIGGKPGFMRMVFVKERKQGKIPESFFEVKKIRLQDASEEGGGITQTLLSHGYDQRKLITLFNEIFRAHVITRPHLRRTTLFQ